MAEAPGEQQREDASPGRRPRLWPWLLAAALLLGLCVRALLPWALEGIAERQASAALGARVEIDDVELALLRSTVSVTGVRVSPEAPGAPPSVRLPRVSVRVAPKALLDRRLVLSHLVIESPELAAVRTEQGTLDFGIAPAEGAESDRAAEAPAFALRLQRLRVSDARLEIRAALPERSLEARIDALEVDELALGGAAAEGAFSVARASLSAPRLRISGAGIDPLELAVEASLRELGPAAPVPVELRVRRGEAWLEAEGRVGLSPLSASLDLRWQDLDAPLLLAAFAPGVASFFTSGRFDGDVQLETLARDGADAGGAPAALRVSGSVQARGVRASLGDGDLLAWEGLEADVEEARIPLAGDGAGRIDLRIGRLVWRAPELRVSREPAASPPSGEAPSEPSPIRVRIASAEVSGGQAVLRDRTISPPAELRFEGLEGTVRNLRWPELAVEALTLAATAPGPAALRVSGGLGPAGGELDLAGDRLSLAPLDPYATALASYRIERGAASLATQLRLERDRYRAPTRLVLHDLGLEALGETHFFQDQLGVSPTLALALLRDRGGDITLELPIEGSRAGAGVKLLPVVGRALRTALLNALQAPLSLVGSVVLGGGRIERFDFAPIRFAPGTTAFASAADPRIERLAELLAARPALGVELVPIVVPEDARSLVPEDEAAGDPLAALASRRGAVLREALLRHAGVVAQQVAVREGPLAVGAGMPRVEIAVGALAEAP